MEVEQSWDSSAALVLHSARLMRFIRRHSQHSSSASVRTLSLIDQYGQASVKELATADQCSQPTMTGLINGLVDRGWVQRDPNPADARSSLVSLTREGQAELRRAREHNAALIQRRAAALAISDADLAVAASVLTRLTDPTIAVDAAALSRHDARDRSRE